jgi:hypothetical protein
MRLSLHLPQTFQEDAVRSLHDKDTPAGAIHERLVGLFEDKAMGY